MTESGILMNFVSAMDLSDATITADLIHQGIQIIVLINFDEWDVMFDGVVLKILAALNQPLQIRVVIKALFDNAGKFGYFIKMALEVLFAHNDENAANVLQVVGGKAFFPGAGDVAAFKYHVLVVLYGGFYHFGSKRPEKKAHVVIVIYCQVGAARADECHFQMVQAGGRVVEFFNEFLGDKGFPHVGRTAD